MVVQQRIVPHSVEVEVNAWSQPMLDWYKGECVTMVSKNLLDRYQKIAILVTYWYSKVRKIVYPSHSSG